MKKINKELLLKIQPFKNIICNSTAPIIKLEYRTLSREIYYLILDGNSMDTYIYFYRNANAHITAKVADYNFGFGKIQIEDIMASKYINKVKYTLISDSLQLSNNDILFDDICHFLGEEFKQKMFLADLAF